MSVDRNSIQRLRLAIRAQANNSDLYLHLGIAYHRAIDYWRAVRTYQKGLVIDALNDRLHCYLGLTYHNLGEHALAISSYSEAILINGESDEAHYYLGFVLIQEGKAEEAIECLSKAIELNPSLHEAYHYLAMAMLQTGGRDDAIALLVTRISVEYPQLTPACLFTLGDLIGKRRGLPQDEDHLRVLSELMREGLGKKEIHVFGDSHRSVFSNIQGFLLHNVGAGTAYNLVSTESSSGAGRKILEACSRLDPCHDAIILVFGEIDCMEHIFKNAFRSGVDIREALADLAQRYQAFVESLEALGFTVLIYGASFSGTAANSYGGIQERNWLTRELNQYLKKFCENAGGRHFSSIEDIVINEEFHPCFRLTKDGRHLDDFPRGSEVLQAIILSRFLTSIRSKQQTHRVPTLSELDRRDQAHNRPYILIQKPAYEADHKAVVCRYGRLGDESRNGIQIAVGDEIESCAVIDMLDHYIIDAIEFDLIAEDHAERSKIEAKIYAVSEKTTQLIVSTTMKLEARARFASEIEPVTARLLAVKFHASEELEMQTKQLVRLSKIGIYGEYRSVCWSPNVAMTSRVADCTKMPKKQI